METHELERLLKKLEKYRDFSIKSLSPENLVEEFFLMNFNIFVSTFFYAITELKKPASNIDEIYILYLSSRHNVVRYLLELYLTILNMTNSSVEERLMKAYSYRVSGKINIHKLEFSLLHLDKKFGHNEPKKIERKLNINREAYREFIKQFGKLSDIVPDELDAYFDGLEIKQNFKQLFGFEFYKHNKIDYMYEIKNNPLMSEVVRDILLLQYPLLSMDTHPTPASLIDFEIFISKSETDKKLVAEGRREAHGTILTLLGEQMEGLIKHLLGLK